MEIRLKVHGILSDQNTDAQIIILRDEQNVEILPIWVGVTEGNTIRLVMEGIVPPRPMTHDLLKNLIEQLGVEVMKVVVTDMNNSTYFAKVHLKKGEEEMTVDSRPSDAIALALRSHVPIYATDEVLKKKSPENLDAWLQRLKPKDSGQYNA